MIPFFKRYFSALYFPIAWTLIIIILLSLPGRMLPNETGFTIPNFDKLVHMGLFGGFVFLWGLYMTKRSSAHHTLLQAFFIFYVIANLFGYGMELVQKYWIPGRDYDLADVIADMAGAGIAYGICNLLLITPANDKNN
jgi:VanZ family protein